MIPHRRGKRAVAEDLVQNLLDHLFLVDQTEGSGNLSGQLGRQVRQFGARLLLAGSFHPIRGQGRPGVREPGV